MTRDANVLPLFAYGTLRDSEYQLELFGRTYPMRAARLTGFIVCATGHGYLAAAARADGVIDGTLVALDDAAYRVADEWEDLSVYVRLEVAARETDGTLTRAYLYAQPDCGGAPVLDGRIADRARADVIADIRRFRAAAASTIDAK
jgi:gamma-glutamylcyclotransferase (GGCT)/AIG2-like uncharacterized protein YtfP